MTGPSDDDWRTLEGWKRLLERSKPVAANALRALAHSLEKGSPMNMPPPGAWGGDAEPRPTYGCKKCGAPIPWPGLCQHHQQEAINESRRAAAEMEQQQAQQAQQDQQATPAPAPEPAATAPVAERTPVAAAPPSPPTSTTTAKRRRGRPRKVNLDAIDALREQIESGHVQGDVLFEIATRALELQYAAMMAIKETL